MPNKIRGIIEQVASEYFQEVKFKYDLEERKRLFDQALKDILELLPKEQKFVDSGLTWGDTEYNSNAVRYGINACLAEVKRLFLDK